MVEENGNLWSIGAVDARCITTNGDVVGIDQARQKGKAVMGKGVALQAAIRYPTLPFTFGELLLKYPQNRPMKLLKMSGNEWLVSFPVKHHWRDKADPDLVLDSALKLRDMADKFGWQRVVIPCPGCGSGQLDWVAEVRPMLALVLDDRFVVAIPDA